MRQKGAGSAEVSRAASAWLTFLTASFMVLWLEEFNSVLISPISPVVVQSHEKMIDKPNDHANTQANTKHTLAAAREELGIIAALGLANFAKESLHVDQILFGLRRGKQRAGCGAEADTVVTKSLNCTALAALDTRADC